MNDNQIPVTIISHPNRNTDQQITVLQTMLMQQDQDNAKLQKANAEQASQIKQLQQMFMVADQQQAIEKSKEATAQ